MLAFGKIDTHSECPQLFSVHQRSNLVAVKSLGEGQFRLDYFHSECPDNKSYLQFLDATDSGCTETRRRAVDRARISELAAQILDLERSIQVLRIEQNQAQKRLDSYKYPVLTLPNEITSEIFVQFLPVFPVPPPLKGPLSPTLLTHICRRWRDIAHATPALWRATSLEFVNPFCDEKDNNILQLWMARSRTYPLSIHIRGYYEGLCMETLTSHRARWEYLQSTWMSYGALLSLRDPMPSLRHLDISSQYHFPDPIIVGDAPLLRSVRIVIYVDNVILPWRQLTSLILISVSPGECTAILRQTALLIHCKLSFISSADDQQPDIELPFVKSFVLMQNQQLEAPYLYSLILPALATLRIPEADLGLDPIGGLKSFLVKSGCTLRELHIMGDRTVTQATYRRAFPTIQEMSFEEDCDVPSESDSE
ncbi:hypothetical protein C8R43DRAFT_956861 [Mycena crocata]|nr:hypothetical protein C8R43DRAFT_956861 [Mycena crocata]